MAVSESSMYVYVTKLVEEKSPTCRDISQRWREEGTVHYKSALKKHSPSEQMRELSAAKAFYERALIFARDGREISSASKNMAMTCWRITKILIQQNEKVSKTLYYYTTIITSFNKATHHGKGSQLKEWMDALYVSYTDVLEDISTAVDDCGVESRLQIVENIAVLLEKGEEKAEWYIKLGQILFHKSVRALEAHKFKEALSLLRDCYRPTEEAKMAIGYDNNNGPADLRSDIAVLEEDVTFHTCHAEALQSLHRGDQLLNIDLNENESLNMDLTWDIVDTYHQAVVLTRGIDVATEAWAMSRLGKVYDKVFKLKYRAKEYYKMCVHLAHSLQPRTFDNEEWFRECKQTLETYQQQIIEEENKKWENIRKKYLPDLKPDLDKLQEAYGKIGDYPKDPKCDFIQFVYKTFPPKGPRGGTPKAPKLADSVKKVYQKAMVHYHPDKVDIEKHGEKWKVLSEEITKCLTNVYNSYKM